MTPFSVPLKCYLYLLQFRSVFLKDLKAIPLKYNQQEGLGLLVSVGGQNPSFDHCPPTDPAGLVSMYTDQPLVIFHFPDYLKCPVTSAQIKVKSVHTGPSLLLQFVVIYF